jgi:hypothetical protein
MEALPRAVTLSEIGAGSRAFASSVKISTGKE